MSEADDCQHNEMNAALLLANEYRDALDKFNDYLGVLYEIFFFEYRRHEEQYWLSLKLIAPVTPFSELEQEAAQNRFVRLVHTFEESSEAELARFAEESEALRQLYREFLSTQEQKWKDAESKRQDEFFALSQLCRREVSALTARLKADTAQTTSELEALDTLKVALDSKTQEVEAMRKHLAVTTQSHEEERRKWLADLARERDSSRQMLQADRDKFSEQLRSVVKQAEEERTRHHEEIVEINKRHGAQLESVRKRLLEQQDESDKLRRRIDELGVDQSRELRLHSEEKNRLMRLITDLEISYESLKRNLSEVESDAKMNQFDLENMTETRKLLEIQSFKKRLVDTAKLLESSTFAGGVGLQSQSKSPRYSGERHVDTQDIPPPYREPSVSILKNASLGYSNRDRSRSPASTITLRSPSETFVRLANMNRQLSPSSSLSSAQPTSQRVSSPQSFASPSRGLW